MAAHLAGRRRGLRRAYDLPYILANPRTLTRLRPMLLEGASFALGATPHLMIKKVGDFLQQHPRGWRAKVPAGGGAAAPSVGGRRRVLTGWQRTEERREGKEGGRPCESRGWR